MNNRKHTEETKKKISQSLMGHKISLHTKEKLLEANLGVARSEEVKKKISISMKGVSTKWLTGRKSSEEAKKKLSDSISGEKHWRWNGRTPLNRLVRTSKQMKTWKKDIFARDNYTCQLCEVRGDKLNADHIEAFSLIMAKHNIDTIQNALICADLWNIENGRTLCEPCHRKTENYGYKASKQLLLYKLKTN